MTKPCLLCRVREPWPGLRLCIGCNQDVNLLARVGPAEAWPHLGRKRTAQAQRFLDAERIASMTDCPEERRRLATVTRLYRESYHLQEIADALGFKAKSAAYQRVVRLRAAGVLQARPTRSRKKAQRDAKIVDLRARGWKRQTIADALGVSFALVKMAIRRTNQRQAHAA